MLVINPLPLLDLPLIKLFHTNNLSTLRPLYMFTYTTLMNEARLADIARHQHQ